MPNELATFEDLYGAIIARVKADPADSATLASVKEMLNTRYREICARKKWKWLRDDSMALYLNDTYTTGTATATNGSPIVTGTGTSWTEDMKGWFFRPTGAKNNYRVTAVQGTTSLHLNGPYVETTATDSTYKLVQAMIPLPPDAEDVDDMRIDGQPCPLTNIGPARMNYLRQTRPTMSGYPLAYTIEGTTTYYGPILGEFLLGHDFLTGATTKSVHFFPMEPDQEYRIHLVYKRTAPPLSLDTDVPLIPIEYRHVLFFLVLADWSMRNDNEQEGKYYESLGKDKLKEMQVKYVDTDDVLQFATQMRQQKSSAWLRQHSDLFFDREG